MARYNPENQDHVKRLRRAMGASNKALLPFRKEMETFSRKYAGSHYGGMGDSATVPANLFQLAIRVYQRSLVSGIPQCVVESNYAKAKTEAYELELGLNRILREIDFRSSLLEVVKQAMFRMGILKVGITPMEMEFSEGYLHAADMPYADPVLFDDWVHDMTARREEQMDFCGNRYRVPLDDVRENPLFNQKAREAVGRKEGQETQDFGSTQAGDGQSISIGDQPFWNETYVDYVDLWDIWLPKEGLFITLPDDESIGPLRVQEWEGPERGPYELLCYDHLPGNIIPISQGQGLLDLHDLINSLYRKLADQSERQKTLGVASGAATASGVAKAIIDAQDGDVINSDDPGGVRELRLGGMDQQTLAFVLSARDLFSYAGGNIDALGGLARQADTVGQEEIISQSSAGLIGELQSITNLFVKRCMEKIGFYIYTDPYLTMDLTKPVATVGSMPIEVPFSWGPERRTTDFYDMIMEVDPYSMRVRGPNERLQSIMQAVQMLQPLMPYMQQRGVTFNVEEFWREYAKLTDCEALTRIITLGGVGLEYAPGMTGNADASGVGGPTPAAPQPPSPGGQSAGPTPGAQNLQMMQMMASAPPQPQQAGAM
jgi:hypothetical protein